MLSLVVSESAVNIFVYYVIKQNDEFGEKKADVDKASERAKALALFDTGF